MIRGGCGADRAHAGRLPALDAPRRARSAARLDDITGCAHLFGGETATRGASCTASGAAGSRCAAASPARRTRHARSPAGPGRPCRAGRGGAGGQAPADHGPELSDETTTALRRAGFKRIADLADRPSAPLTGRFGTELTTRLTRLLGREDRRITPARPLAGLRRSRPSPSRSVMPMRSRASCGSIGGLPQLEERGRRAGVRGQLPARRRRRPAHHCPDRPPRP